MRGLRFHRKLHYSLMHVHCNLYPVSCILYPVSYAGIAVPPQITLFSNHYSLLLYSAAAKPTGAALGVGQHLHFLPLYGLVLGDDHLGDALSMLDFKRF